MQIYTMPDPVRYRQMNTEQLREAFLVSRLFNAGKIDLVYTDADRAVIGSAVPALSSLTLGNYPELRSDFFNQRRELGILNIGDKGSIIVDGKTFPMEHLDGLYVGRGVRNVIFESAQASNPANFYLLSYLAHADYPTAHASKAQAAAVQIGTEATLNRRTIYKYIHAEGIKSCQVVLGFTELASGSAWNTMPPHTHLRRSEIYMYFKLPPEQRVFHLMGEPQETRHILVADKQVVISPSWSIHSGVGTSNYSFCWGMGGENQKYDDMDPAPLIDLK